jgi:HK97 family phage major capsid protein
MTMRGSNQSTADIARLAREAILAGRLDEGKRLTQQVRALKQLDGLETDDRESGSRRGSQDVVRLPFMAMAPTTTRTTSVPPVEVGSESDEFGVKSWHVLKYGEPDRAMAQVRKELYGANYEYVEFAKHRDFARYIRFGVADPALKNVLLLTDRQLALALRNGFLVSEIKATMVEGIDTTGGYTVPEDFRTDIIERLPGLTIVRPRATVATTTRDVLSMIKRTGGDSRYIGNTRVTWVDESPSSLAVSATNATFGKAAIPVNVTLANCPLTRSTLEDSAIDAAEYLKDELAPAMALDEDQQFLVGDGNGKPSGILMNGAPFDGDIKVLGSLSATTILADSIPAMPMKLDAQYRNDKANCVWMGAKATYETIYKIKDGNGRYLWRNNDDNLAEGYPQQLQGYAIAESEAMQAVAANNYPIFFGNLKRGYTIVDRIGVGIERYQDAFTAQTDSVVFYARRRLGGQPTAGWAFVLMQIRVAP